MRFRELRKTDLIVDRAYIQTHAHTRLYLLTEHPCYSCAFIRGIVLQSLIESTESDLPEINSQALYIHVHV